MSDRVVFEAAEDGVGTVTLNRPDKLNAMDQGVFDGLHEATDRAREAIEAGTVRAVLVRAEGRAFSSGLDISLFGQQASGDKPADDWIAYLQQAFTGLEDLRVPVVAAIRGVAFGAGCQLALAAHMRLAAPDAELSLLEAKWALVPDLGGLTRLPRVVGLGRAADMSMTARRVDADTALAWGLVDRVLPAEDFEATSRAFVAELAAGPTVAIGAVPGLLRRSYRAQREDMLAAERQHQQACLSSADFVEAATAAMQRRSPEFTGR